MLCVAVYHRAWLHTCLHLLVQLQQRYIAPQAFTPPPLNLFWDADLLHDNSNNDSININSSTSTELSSMYRCVCV